MSQENVLRKKYEVPFVQVPREIINHKSLSWKAKGLMAYLLDKPDGWKFSFQGIASQGRESEGAIRSGLNELKAHGYLKITKIKNSETKRYIGFEWEITPFSNNFSETGFSSPGSSSPGKSRTSNNQDLSDPKKDSVEKEAPPMFSFAYKGNSLIRMPIHCYHELCQEHGEEKLLKEMEKATDHLAANGVKKKDYAAFMRNWMKKAQEWQKPKKEEAQESQPQETELFKKNKQLAEYVQSCYDAQKSDGKYDKIRLNDSFITIYTSEDISTAIPYCDENFSVVLIRLAEYLEIKLRDED